ncbi:hypothetical protein [Streptomyces sp. NPDC091879]|uniref:hypothetical protein n=1 Tax=Streptomyces sp. NPDC091879 TaxID=3366006 RepID=UPI0038246638
MPDNNSPEDDWRTLQPNAEHAIRTLLSKVVSHESPLELFEAYAYAKEVAARAVWARMEMHLPAENSTFRALHAKIHEKLQMEYGGVVPAKLLKVPYGGRTHERLFTLLQEKIGQAVPAEILRITTQDAVHTERRTRELRELGLDVIWYERDEVRVYELRNLELNLSRLPAIVRNNIRKDQYLTENEKKEFLRKSGIPENG